VDASEGGANSGLYRSGRLLLSTADRRQAHNQGGDRRGFARRLFSRPTSAGAPVGLAIPLLQTHPLLLSGTRGGKMFEKPAVADRRPRDVADRVRYLRTSKEAHLRRAPQRFRGVIDSAACKRLSMGRLWPHIVPRGWLRLSTQI